MSLLLEPSNSADTVRVGEESQNNEYDVQSLAWRNIKFDEKKMTAAKGVIEKIANGTINRPLTNRILILVIEAAKASYKISSGIDWLRDRSDKEDFKRITGRASILLAVLWQSYKKSKDRSLVWPPPGIRDNVIYLVKTVHDIHKLMDRKFNVVKQIFLGYAVLDTGKLKRYERRLDLVAENLEPSNIKINELLLEVLQVDRDSAQHEPSEEPARGDSLDEEDTQRGAAIQELLAEGSKNKGKKGKNTIDEDMEEETSGSVQGFRPNEVGPTKARQRLSQTSEEETPEEETPEEESTGNEEPSKKKKFAMTPKGPKHRQSVRRQTAPQPRSPISGPSISNNLNNHDSGTMYNEDFGNTYNSTFSTMHNNNSRKYVLPRRKPPRTKRRPGDVSQELTVKSSHLSKGALSGELNGDDSDPPIEEVIERKAEPTADDCVIEERSAEDKLTQADDDGESHEDSLNYESLEMEDSPPNESTGVFWSRPHHPITAKVHGLNFETQLVAAFTNVGFRGRFRIQTSFNQSALRAGMLEEEISIILDNDLQVSEDKVYTAFAAVLAPFSGVVYTPRQVHFIVVNPLTGDVIQGPVGRARLGLGATAAKSDHDTDSAESGEASRGPGVEANSTYSGHTANNKTTTDEKHQARRGGRSGGPDDDDSHDSPHWHGSPKVPGGGLPKSTASQDRHRFHNDDDDDYHLHLHRRFHFDQRYSTSPITIFCNHRYSTSTTNMDTDYRDGYFYGKQHSEYDTDNNHPKKKPRRYRSPL